MKNKYDWLLRLNFLMICLANRGKKIIGIKLKSKYGRTAAWMSWFIKNCKKDQYNKLKCFRVNISWRKPWWELVKMPVWIAIEKDIQKFKHTTSCTWNGSVRGSVTRLQSFFRQFTNTVNYFEAITIIVRWQLDL